MRTTLALSFVASVLGSACTVPAIGGDVCPAEPPRLAERPPPSGRTRLAYTLTVDDRPQLWLLDLDQTGAAPLRLDAVGTGPGPLQPNSGGGRPIPSGIWSPAGGTVAVALGTSMFEPAAVGVIDVASPGTVRLLGGNVGSFPWFDDAREAWSPEGDRIVASDWADGSVRVMRADGGGSTVVASGITTNIGDATWSPDGRYVGFGVAVGDTSAFYVSPADADDPRDVARNTYWWGRAGSQVIGYVDSERWEVLDIETGASEIIDVYSGSAPVFSADGQWLFTPGPPGPEMRRRGCDEPIALTGAPPVGWDVKATADGNHIVFHAAHPNGGPDGSTAWVADRTGDTWSVRHLYTPTTPQPRVDWPLVSVTGARIAWLLGGNDTDRFLVTHEGVLDPAAVVTPGIVQPVISGTYWFSPDLRRLAYLAGAAQSATLRVLDIADPSAPIMLGEVVGPGGRPISSVSWSPSGNALAYAVWERPLEPPLTSDLFVVEVVAGALGTPRSLGSTLHPSLAAFDWEP